MAEELSAVMADCLKRFYAVAESEGYKATVELERIER